MNVLQLIRYIEKTPKYKHLRKLNISCEILDIIQHQNLHYLRNENGTYNLDQNIDKSGIAFIIADLESRYEQIKEYEDSGETEIKSEREFTTLVDTLEKQSRKKWFGLE